MTQCGADTPVREKPRSAMYFKSVMFFKNVNSAHRRFERARLQPVRYSSRKSGALAPEGGGVR